MSNQKREVTAQKMHEVLKKSIERRVETITSSSHDTSSKLTSIGILFSGGVDSAVLAAIAGEVMPLDHPIDLINVSFSQQVGEVLIKRIDLNHDLG